MATDKETYKKLVFDFVNDMDAPCVIWFDKVMPCDVLPSKEAIPYFVAFVKDFKISGVGVNQFQIFKFA